MPEDNPKKPKKRYYMEVHPDLVEILEKIRKNIKSLTWNVMDKEITWKELTEILAKKINAKESLII